MYNGPVSVRQSVCRIYQPLQQRATGLLLGAPRAGDIDRLLQARMQQAPGAQQQRRHSSTAHSSTAVSRKLRTVLCSWPPY